jgi:F-type H+-transporting ATPase subunit delta
MASAKKQIQQLSRNLYSLSLEHGRLSSARVAGVLEYIEKNRPPHTMAVLKAYHRLVAAEVARGQAIVEHAGPVSEATLKSIGEAMTARYKRPVTPIAQRNDKLLAGLRVRVADDLYEQSIAGQLAALGSSV